MVRNTIERIRAVLKKQGVTPAGLAKRAELHPNTLYGADKEGWNPTATTLIAVEPFLDELERLPDRAEPTEAQAA
jgi:lambda repressor-like predicted transcriptional regulator